MAQSGSKGGIAVIGMGPRGLGALEALAAQLPQQLAPLRVDIFDPGPEPGAGPNFDPDESRVCKLNIPMRDIAIRPPEFSKAGAFADWLDDAPGPDAFPTRADLGRYLEARYADLRGLGTLAIQPHRTQVTGLRPAPDGGWLLQVGDGWHGPFAEVLMVPGQPAVTPDDQLAAWQDHAAQGTATLAEAYPARELVQQARDWTGKTVAIRGLALSAFDIMRSLTVAQGGRFADGKYIASGDEPAAILPFSLDGRPPFPKPETGELDARFAPTDSETERFVTALDKAATGSPCVARRAITEALVPPAVRILHDFDVPFADGGVVDWLDREWDAPGSQEDGSSLDTLRSGIAMAEGVQPPTIGFIIGQVWRKWQDALRAGYNPVRTPPETATMIVGFDEGMKRYSYGPPVASSRELAALIDAGLVDLDFAADPEIDLVSAGWNLRCAKGAKEAQVMIDGVMPSPDLSIVTEPLIKGLVDEGRLATLGEKLAADTEGDGRVIGKDGLVSPGLCMLGRLTLGSVIAVDSLHDCFGAASERWAEGAVRRLTKG